MGSDAQNFWTGLILASQMLPTCLLGGLGGSLAGRWPRRNVVFLAQAILLVLAFLLAFLVLAGSIRPWQLLLIALANGMVGAIDMPARLTFVYDMVGRDDLINAVALNSMLFNTARVAGPALAGLALPSIGAGMCFLLNGVSYRAVLAALAAMDPARMHVILSGAGPRHTLRDGFRYLATVPGLQRLLILVGALAMLGWPVLALLPALTHKLGSTETGYAWLLSSLGAGTLATALVVATFGAPCRARLFLGAGLVLAALGELELASGTAHGVGPGWLFAAGRRPGPGLFHRPGAGAAVGQRPEPGRNHGHLVHGDVRAPPAGHLLAGLSADHMGLSRTLIGLGVGVGARRPLARAALAATAFNHGDECQLRPAAGENLDDRFISSQPVSGVGVPALAGLRPQRPAKAGTPTG